LLGQVMTMSDFRKSCIGSFDKELQALIDYGHDCCARIDDRIYECCQRIRKAHKQELDNMRGAYEISMALMEKQPSPVAYDVLGNERHKAVCKLREMSDGYPSYSAFPFAKWYEDLSTALGIDKGEVSCAKVRDTLIHLLGGDAMEVEDGVDAGRCGETNAGVGVPVADKRRIDCAVHQLAEEVAPITSDLRGTMERYCNFKDENRVQLGECEFDQLCDSIDAVHKDLERENEELRQRTMYPAESERINMFEREVKRLAAECKTQRNNFDQATSAREHWKSLYEQSLEQIHDLEHDVEMWRDRAEDMRMERDDALKEHHAWAPESHYVMLPKDADGVPIHVGDVMEWVRYKDDDPTIVRTVSGIGNSVFFAWSDEQGRYAQYEAYAYRHHHADSWERIIEDARTCTGSAGNYTAVPSMRWTNEVDALVARCKALAGDAE